MSWARISSEMKRTVYNQLSQLSSIFERKYRKNLDRVYIVHPSPYTRAVIIFMRNFTSKKLKRKIIELYNWESLEKEIRLEDIKLPESSKDFITKAYNVTKVNSKGKSQKRLIKFTANSLLNIDPKTKKIQNEKKISEIVEFGTFYNINEIQMTFKEPLRGVMSKKSRSGESFRRYVFNSKHDRDEVVMNIFKTGFNRINLPQEFKVVKVNKRGRHQDRTFKLTCDSLLNLDANNIKVFS